MDDGYSLPLVPQISTSAASQYPSRYHETFLLSDPAAEATDVQNKSAAPAAAAPTPAVYYAVASPAQIPPGATIVAAPPSVNAPSFPAPTAFAHSPEEIARTIIQVGKLLLQLNGFWDYVLLTERNILWRSLDPRTMTLISRIRSRCSAICLVLSLGTLVFVVAGVATPWVTFDYSYTRLNAHLSPFLSDSAVSRISNMPSQIGWQTTGVVGFSLFTLNVLLTVLMNCKCYFTAIHVMFSSVLAFGSYATAFTLLSLTLQNVPYNVDSKIGPGFYLSVIGTVLCGFHFITLIVSLVKEKRAHATSASNATNYHALTQSTGMKRPSDEAEDDSRTPASAATDEHVTDSTRGRGSSGSSTDGDGESSSTALSRRVRPRLDDADSTERTSTSALAAAPTASTPAAAAADTAEGARPEHMARLSMTDAEKMHAFLEWAVSVGGSFDSIDLRVLEGGDRGFVAKRAIAEGEELARMPISAVLSERLARESQVGKAMLSSTVLKRRGIQTLPGRTLMCAYMMAYRNDPGCPFYLYFQILPQTYSDPLWWTPDELAQLEGTNVGGYIEERRKTVRDSYLNVFPALSRENPSLFPKSVFTWEAFLWAYSGCSSRAFPLRISTLPGGKEAYAIGNPMKEKCIECLLPLLDMMNHQYCAPITWLTDNTMVRFLTGTRALEGQQVFNNYGPKSNEELLMGYGFCLSPNPADHVKIRLLSLPDDAFQSKIMRWNGLDVDHYIHMNSLPVSLLSSLRVYILNPLEQYAYLGPDSADVCMPLSNRSELDSLFTLTEILQDRYGKLGRWSEDDDQIALTNPLTTGHTRLAIIYRSGQKAILRAAYVEARNRFNELGVRVASETCKPYNDSPREYFRSLTAPFDPYLPTFYTRFLRGSSVLDTHSLAYSHFNTGRPCMVSLSDGSAASNGVCLMFPFDSTFIFETSAVIQDRWSMEGLAHWSSESGQSSSAAGARGNAARPARRVSDNADGDGQDDSDSDSDDDGGDGGESTALPTPLPFHEADFDQEMAAIELLSSFDTDVRLALTLLKDMSLGEDARFVHFYTALQSHASINPFWDSFLTGPSPVLRQLSAHAQLLLEPVTQALSQTDEVYRELFPRLLDEFPSIFPRPSDFSHKKFRWATAVVASYSWQFIANGAEAVYVLPFPGKPMYSPNSEFSFRFLDSERSIIRLDFPAFTNAIENLNLLPVTMSYGHGTDNLTLLREHGFVLPRSRENPFEATPIPPELLYRALADFRSEHPELYSRDPSPFSGAPSKDKGKRPALPESNGAAAAASGAAGGVGVGVGVGGESQSSSSSFSILHDMHANNPEVLSNPLVGLLPAYVLHTLQVLSLSPASTQHFLSPTCPLRVEGVSDLLLPVKLKMAVVISMMSFAQCEQLLDAYYTARDRVFHDRAVEEAKPPEAMLSDGEFNPNTSNAHHHPAAKSGSASSRPPSEYMVNTNLSCVPFGATANPVLGNHASDERPPTLSPFTFLQHPGPEIGALLNRVFLGAGRAAIIRVLSLLSQSLLDVLSALPALQAEQEWSPLLVQELSTIFQERHKHTLCSIAACSGAAHV